VALPKLGWTLDYGGSRISPIASNGQASDT